MHGGVSLDRIKEPNMEGLKEGFGNLDKHVRNLRSFGQQVIVHSTVLPVIRTRRWKLSAAIAKKSSR